MNNNKGQTWGFTGECLKDFKNSEENVTVHTAELYLIPNKKKFGMQWEMDRRKLY